ncbi:MAG: sialate O-acetylesterase [Rubripirellula sp.]
MWLNRRLGMFARTAALCLITGFTSAQADVQLGSLFSNNAVLQRDVSLPIWGTADPGERITVEFAGQSKVCTAEKGTGKWRVNFDPLSTSSNPRSLQVRGASDELTIDGLLVGEVWLASGQSNMAMRVELAHDVQKELSDSECPLLRVFTLDRASSSEPLGDCSGQWIAASAETAGRFSATAFFFGRELQRELEIPVGIIVAAWGGSTIEAWTSKEAHLSKPELQPLLQSWEEQDAAYTAEIEASEKAKYELDFAAWKSVRKEAVRTGTDSPKAPRRPINPRLHHHHPSTLYNGMIAPIVPYAIRGAIWYQGESNAFTEEASALYELQLPLLINDWRSRWGQGDFPFAWIQLPPSRANQVAWARIRESMRRATALPNTGMAVTFDLGEEPLLLHPKNKQAFAHRLALWARAEVYGSDIAWSGPRLIGSRVGQKGISLRFDQAKDLASLGEPIVGFEIQSVEGDWHTATAVKRPNGITLTAPGVRNPTAARYAWGNNPVGNLVNSHDLPASPFTTEAAVYSPALTAKSKRLKGPPSDLNRTPLVPVDIGTFPGNTNHLDVFLLLGQSNMKGRGVMPAVPLKNPRIVMLHKRTDQWFCARHPLHLIGDPDSFEGADNAGVGPGLAFATSLSDKQATTRIALIPCAVGGTGIGKWQQGQRLYDETIRRAQLALQQGPKGKTRIAGALWLQGEADSGTPDRIASYSAKLKQMIADLRKDLESPDLPFIACTIGELREGSVQARREINAVLLDLPNQVDHAACVDSRNFAADIGDSVHFDTATQTRHGQLFAEKYMELTNVK